MEVDLFASRLSTQLPRFYSWRPDPQSQALDAFFQGWSKVRGYAFPPFALEGRCLRQLLAKNVLHLVQVAPVWQSQPWYPLLLQLCVAPPILFPHYPGLLTRQGEVHKPISGASLSRWLKDIISQAGIDTSIFKAQSVRGASASAAYERGASLQDILDLADWSTDSTLRGFYYRPRHNSGITDC